eukprot:6761665-Alexandrium_andersonii.AAC.1
MQPDSQATQARKHKSTQARKQYKRARMHAHKQTCIMQDCADKRTQKAGKQASEQATRQVRQVSAKVGGKTTG